MVHPTDLERSQTSNGRNSIARTDSPTIDTPPDASSNLMSVEVGALVPFETGRAHVHLAPGARYFGSPASSVLFGVAVGADFENQHGPGFALEGSVYAGNSSSDLRHVEDSIDLFAGVTLPSKHGAIAVGPSAGMIGMPGGHSVMTLGLGLRLTGRQ